MVNHITMASLSDLNPDQQAAASHPHGPALILAGAGTGKTTTLIHRAGFLLDQGIHPTRLMLLTFTNKAAAHAQHKLVSLAGANLPFAGTFHRFAALLLRRDGRLIGLPPHYSIYDSLDQLEAVKQAMKLVSLERKHPTPGAFLAEISRAKQELLGPLDYVSIAHGDYQQQTALVYQEYQRILDKADAVDFDDLLRKTVELWQHHGECLEQWQAHFAHVLIDEYQDTNHAQYQIVKMLVAPHQQVTAVGDAAQSIYRWRGADYRNIVQFTADFANTTTYRLEQNYRSTQPILDAATAVISHNRNHPVLKLWTNKQDGESVVLVEAEDEKDEAIKVVLLAHQLGRGQGRLAVLYRTNAQSRPIEEELIRAGIGYELVGGVRFYERKEIKDVLALVRLVINPSDLVAGARVEKLGKRKAAAYRQWLTQFAWQKLTSAEIIKEVLKASHYLERYDRHDPEDGARLDNIAELESVATEHPDLAGFLETVALVEQATPSHNPDDLPSVSLMTIHSAKGLEFDWVVVVGMEEGVFPHSRSLFEAEEMEEERRLCYVAMTRAKSRLFLSYARSRLLYGAYQHGLLSRFISEIPAPLLGASIARTRRVVSDQDLALADQLLDGDIDIDTFLKR